jgi:hypothetical protein
VRSVRFQGFEDFRLKFRDFKVSENRVLEVSLFRDCWVSGFEVSSPIRLLSGFRVEVGC